MHNYAAMKFAIAATCLWAMPLPLDITGSTQDASVTVTANQAAAAGAPVTGTTVSTRVEEWMRAPACSSGWYRNDLEPGCENASYEIVVKCLDGTNALQPWWMRYKRSNGLWSSWTLVGWYQCPGDAFLVAVENAWDAMPITANRITVQPGTGWVLTTVPTIVYVDRTPRTMRTTLLGTRVIIRATPSNYTWTWGDGATTVTTKPGAAYPNATVSHTYMYREGFVTIRLRTSWRGSYSTNGGATWRSAPGTAYTTSTPVTVQIYNPHSYRVDCDLAGTCLTGADGPADTP